jgi:hypothetical protein
MIIRIQGAAVGEFMANKMGEQDDDRVGVS